jgi:BASS family bile acid:Na+ symporter
MSVDQLINVLVMVTLVEMMVATGLGVSVADLRGVAGDWRLLARAAVANYVCVPLATAALLHLFGAQPMVEVGFLILAVCPGAPYGPPLTAVARGNVAASVGLMVALAGSSAVAAPLLLSLLLPLMTDDPSVTVDAGRLVGTLLATQLAPLGFGLAVRAWRPALAGRLRNPANLLSKVLNLLAVGLILVTQYQTLAAIRPAAFVGMLVLLVVSLAAGWLFGGPADDVRRSLTITTALRNVGLGLVIATGAFANTPAVTAALAYGLFAVLGSLVVALGWSRRGVVTLTPEGQPAPGGVAPVKKNGQTHPDGSL